MTRRVKSLQVRFHTPIILITGTPGTGKSTLIDRFKNDSKSQVSCINVSDLIKSEGLHSGFDPEFDTFIVNDRKIRKRLLELLKEEENKTNNAAVLIECHSCGIFEKEALRTLISSVLVLTCPTEVLYDRLQARGYAPNKVSENVTCEIMRVCADEAIEIFPHLTVTERENASEADGDAIIKFLTEAIKETNEGDKGKYL